MNEAQDLMFSTVIKASYFNSSSINVPIQAKRLLGEGQIVFLAGPDEKPVFTGTLKKGEKDFNKPLYCQPIYNETHPLLPELPLKVGDKLIFKVKKGNLRLLSITKDAWRPADKRKRFDPREQPTNKDQAPPPKLPPNPDYSDILKAFAQWIQDDPFQRTYRQGTRILPRGTAPRGKGWDFRLREFAYTRSWLPGFPRVHETVAPVRQRMLELREKYDWEQIREKSQISKKDLAQLETDARWIFDWAEAAHRTSMETRTWAIFAAAVTGAPLPDTQITPPMTRVASFASQGLPHELTAWDSRISTSLIYRIDRILDANDLKPDDLPNLAHLRLLMATGGTRPRPLVFRWRNDFSPSIDSSWGQYFVISDFLRQLLGILNNPENGFPRMPMPDGGTGDWDMFDLNLVLFMDGY